MLKTLYIFGPIGKMTELPKSGGQTSARRVIEGFRDYGFTVVPISRHRAEMEGKFAHKVEVMTFAVIDLLRIVGKTFFKSRRKSIFLYLTYGGPLVPYEYIISKTMTSMRIKCATYLQGGQFMDFYHSGSNMHRNLVKKNMDMQELVMFEGKESLEIVKEISQTKLVYFPSYVFRKDIIEPIPSKPIDRLNICYFGRISPQKNVHVIVETFNLLCQKHDNIYLTIVGGLGRSKEYVEEVDKMIETSPFSNHITRKGISPFSYIKEMMQTHHIFLFPTEERCEGHSNALNEAMSQGLIPVVSNYHFNKYIVSNDLLVVDGYDPQDYANKIEYLMEHCDLKKLAVEMRDRVRDNFSYEVVNEHVCDELSKI